MAADGRTVALASGSGGNTTADSTKTLCRYYMNGACKMGSRCQFSHDRNDRPSNTCRYYLKGSCSYGPQCRYDHVKPSSRTQEGSRPSPPSNSSSAIRTQPQPDFETAFANWTPETSNSGSGSYGAGTMPDEQEEEDLGLVSLKSISSKSNVVINSKLRAEAKEFVPSFGITNGSSQPFSYAHAVAGGSVTETEPSYDYTAVGQDLLCPYFIMGDCRQGDACPYLHGDMCDLCNRPVLHPENSVHNAEHRQQCMADHEREMELAFAVAKGEGKQCGICMETVMEKVNVTSRRFGVLPSCKHCFCLDCIRKWRRAEAFENKVVRACPECRTRSDFVIPSTVWVEEDEEKRALLDAYQSSMKQKTCKYFRDGQIECPFGNKCFYRHVKPDGTVIQGESPRSIRRRQLRQQRARGGAGPSADVYLLWDFLEEQDWFRTGRLSIDSDEEDDWFFEFSIDGPFNRMSLRDDFDFDSDEDD